MLEDWVNEVGEHLSLPVADVQVAEILDLAKEAAHNVARPAAPVTTFLVGYAAGLRGGGRDEIAAAVEQVLQLIAARPKGEEN
jgi:uncharacterized membrane protein